MWIDIKEGLSWSQTHPGNVVVDGISSDSLYSGTLICLGDMPASIWATVKSKFKSNLVQLSILCSYFTINHFFICKNFIYTKFCKTCNSLIEKKYCIKVLQNKTTTIAYNINLQISIHGKYVYRLCIKNTEQYSNTNEMSLTNLINIHFRISIA